MNDPSTASKSGSSITRILMIVIPIGVILAGVLVYIRYGEELGLTGKRTPKIVEVTGKVMFRSKPLTAGTIQTIPVSDPTLGGAFGTISEDGSFTLETGHLGTLNPGLFIGEHKVVVYNYLPSVGAAPGPLMTPAVYSTAATTPLRVTITAKSKDEPLEIVLEADENTMSEESVANYMEELPALREQAGSMTRTNPVLSGEGEGGGGRGGFDPEAFFNGRDEDGNGILAGEEIPEQMRDRMETIDTNEDGEISKAEFDAAGPPAGGGGRGGPPAGEDASGSAG